MRCIELVAYVEKDLLANEIGEFPQKSRVDEFVC